MKLRDNFLEEIDFYIFDSPKFDFFYKGKSLNFSDYDGEQYFTTLENFFKNDKNPIIIVNDKNNIIGQKIKINFETNSGYKHEIVIQNKKTIFQLLTSYISEIDDHFYYSKFNLNEPENKSNLTYLKIGRAHV